MGGGRAGTGTPVTKWFHTRKMKENNMLFKK